QLDLAVESEALGVVDELGALGSHGLCALGAGGVGKLAGGHAGAALAALAGPVAPAFAAAAATAASAAALATALPLKGGCGLGVGGVDDHAAVGALALGLAAHALHAADGGVDDAP